MFVPQLCSSRWTKPYYKRNHVVFEDFQVTDNLPNTFEVSTTPRRRRMGVLSGQDKYRRVFNVAQKVASVISEKSVKEFHTHLQNIETLVELISESKAKPYLINQIDPENHQGIADLIGC